MTSTRSPPSELFRLASVKSDDQLARALGVPLLIFSKVISCDKPDELYDLHRIPKRNARSADDYRIAWQSRDEILARSHKAVARRLDDFARRRNNGYPHASVHGYVRGGSTRSNASPHCGARVVVRADIESFFPAITLARIAETLQSMGMHNEAASTLARFVTIQGTLSLGLPESPVISNLVCLGLDMDLQSLADKLGVTYTRYADDMTFSGSENLPSKEQIRSVLRRHGFRLSDRKFKKSKRGQAHLVTGLSVSEPDYPHVPRKLKRILRLELHYCETFGLETHAQAIGEETRAAYLRLEGMVKYVAYIERRKSEALHQQWGRILSKYHGPTTYAAITNQDCRDIFVIGDETVFEVNGLSYMAVGFVRIFNPESMDDLMGKLICDYLAAPGAKGNLHLLEKHGIHWTDAHPDLRTDTLELMTDVLEWSGSIHFAQLPSSDQYSDTYLRFFADFVRQEFTTDDQSKLDICVERNDNVKLPKLEAIVKSEYQRAESEGGRRPKSLPTIRKVSKTDTRLVTLPDFLLASFGNYAKLVTNESVLDFERIRDRVRYVHDADSGTYYTRKRPFVGIGSP